MSAMLAACVNCGTEMFFSSCVVALAASLAQQYVLTTGSVFLFFFLQCVFSLQARGAAPGADAHSGVSVQAGPRVAALQTAGGPHAAGHPGASHTCTCTCTCRVPLFTALL